MRDLLSWMPVKYKLALMFVAVSLLLFGVGGYMVSGPAKAALEREILGRLEFQSRAYATALNAQLRTLTHRTEDFASDGYIREHVEQLLFEMKSGQRDASTFDDLHAHILKGKLPLVDAFLDLTLVSREGEVLFTAGARPRAEAADALRQSIGALEPWYSGLLPPTSSGDVPRFAIGVPLVSLDGERVIGNLVTWVHPGIWVAAALRSNELGPNVGEARIDLQILDRSGNALHIDPQLTAPDGPNPASELVRGGFGLKLTKSSPDTRTVPSASVLDEYYRNRYHINENGWSAQVEVRSSSVRLAIAGLQSRFLAIGIGLAVIASLLFFFMMHLVAGPIYLMGEAARRIEKGDFHTRVDHQSKDELGELARSFNLMAEAVEERTNRLERSARELGAERDRLNAVISSMRNGLVVLDTEGKVVVRNRAAGPLVRLIDSGALAPERHRCEQARDQGNCAACLGDPNGAPRSCVLEIDQGIYEVHSTRLAPDEHGRSGRVLVSRDVSHRHSQDERQIHQERLAVLGEVAAVVAHELNNPLAAISMFNQMLSSELPSGSPLNEHVEIIQRNIETCKRTIRDLLDYATDSSPEIGVVNVHATLEDVLAFLRPLRERSRAEVHLELCGDESEITGDEVQIRQIFVNLVVNAIQALDGVAGHVTIASEVDDDHLVLDVTDDGPGIPGELHERIFKPFYTTKARGDGTGLGLPTARRIAELHGGSLELLESEPHRTTFRVRLRRRTEPAKTNHSPRRDYLRTIE